MTLEDLKLILGKVEELRALLVFTERTIPFLEDVFAFVRELVPLVEELKSSVESTSDKLPKASKQLDKVTTATEMATTEILTIVEGMFATGEIFRAAMDEDVRLAIDVRASAARMEELFRTCPGTPDLEAWVASLRAAWQVHLALLQKPSAVDRVRTALEKLLNDATNIMIALQVQDITAQQIAAVNKLMQSVDDGLGRLLRHFTETPSTREEGAYQHRRLNIPCDEAAEYAGGDERQRTADRVVEEVRNREREESGRSRAARPPSRDKHG